MDDLAIGIDFGTTNCCAAYWFKGKIKVLENKEGGRVTPSVLFITTQNEIVVGEHGKDLARYKPEYAVFEIKRLLGRTRNDPYVQKSLHYFPFSLDSKSDDPVILIEQPSQIIKKTPSEIAATILLKIKKDVENTLGTSVSKAVITVPAYFNVNQRTAVLEAAEKSGFTVLKLLNEPTAAALSYYMETELKTDDYFLVYDLGGGTFDVAILRKGTENSVEVISVGGDSHLGGQDFDNLIIDYVCDELLKKFKFDPRKDRRAMRRLHNECGKSKKLLCSMESTNIILDAFVPNHDCVEIVLTKTQFEAMVKSLFQKTIDLVASCLKSSNLSEGDIKEVILAGGSTRIPKIQEMITEFFDGRKPSMFDNPDECVAKGAALQAAMLSANRNQEITDIKIADVIPLSLGTDSASSKMEFIIKRNTAIPVTVSTTFVTVNNNQRNMPFKIYEGERMNAEKNLLLGTLRIDDLTPAPPGQTKVTVTMKVDINGLLTFTAKEQFKNNSKDLKITYTRGHRNDAEVQNALKDAENHKDEDEKFAQIADQKINLLKYCIRIIYNLEKKDLVKSNKECYELCTKFENDAEYGS